MIREKSSLISLAVVAGLASVAMADGTIFVDPSASAVGQNGTTAHPYTTVQAGYNAAYTVNTTAASGNTETVQLANGTYSAANIGPGPFGDIGVINLGQDGGGAGPSGSEVAGTKIVINGNSSNPNLVNLTETGAANDLTGHPGRAMFDAFNAFPENITVSNLQVNLNSVRDQLAEENTGGSPLIFTNDNLHLQGGVISNQKGFRAITGDYTFANTNIYLGQTGGGLNLMGYVWGDAGTAGSNPVADPEPDTFDGSGNSHIYDSSGNLITNLATLGESNVQGGGFYSNATYSFAEHFATTVPEPASLGVLALGFVGLLARRRGT